LAHIFIFGMGYSARFLAQRLLIDQWQVDGTKRKIEDLESEAIRFFPFDSHQKPQWELPEASFILSSIPPDSSGDPVLRYFSEQLSNRSNCWLGYLSTTGVYGNHEGAWVHEETPCRPSGARQKKRLEAEGQWRDLGAHIFRLAGIYGPGRSAFDQIALGKAKLISKPGHQFGRIHVADIAGILHAAMQKPNPGEIYNLADDEPAEPLDVTRYAFSLLGESAPDPLDYWKAELTPMARTFWQDHKKVRNEKIKTDLGYKFLYPTYRDGLKAIWAERSQ